MPELCPRCGAPVLQHSTVNHKPLLVDALPSPQGNLYLGGDTPVRVLSYQASRYRRLYRAHCVTCPYSAQRYMI